MSAGVMGVAFYLAQRLHDWLLVLPVAAVVLPELPFSRRLRRCLRHAGTQDVLRRSVRLWGPPVLLMGCGVVLAVWPEGDRALAGYRAELNGPGTRCERPERSGVLLSVACPDAGPDSQAGVQVNDNNAWQGSGE